MSTQAEVKSIDTLAFVKAAMVAFGHETGQSLAEVEMQAQRIVDWICLDQAAYWKTEVRKAADGVNQAIKYLQHCRTYKKVGNNEPSCIEDSSARELGCVARSGILRKVTKFATNRNTAAVWQQVSGENLGERCLSGPVATDETDLVALVDTKIDLGHEGSRPDPDFEVRDVNH